MNFDVLTLFPEVFSEFVRYSIIKRAIDKELLSISCTDIRDFSNNKHRKVDDYPFGGGVGMIMTPEPVYNAINSVKKENSRVIYMSPKGKKLNQQLAKQYMNYEHIILLCGHYEGIDNRIIENYVDEELSIGDYVLTGGEIPAMVFIEVLARMIPGVLSTEESWSDESHFNNLLEYPQYTRPQIFNGYEVPQILLSGNHAKIEEWRRQKSIEETLKYRPDLLE